MKLLNPMANQPDNPLTRAIKLGYTPLAAAFAFSLVSNLLYLALPIYTYQIYGRVMSSSSIPTLLVISAGVIFCFILSGVIDHYRAKVLVAWGAQLDAQVSKDVFSTLFEGVVRGHPALRSQALRDLDTFRQMLTGSPFGAFFDLPWMPVFMLILFIIDPLVGVVSLVGAGILLFVTLLQDAVTRPLLGEANEAALKSYGFTDAALRNGEAVRAMGMVPALAARWSVSRQVTMDKSSIASEVASVLSNVSKFARQGVQVLIIAIGAYLVIKGKIHSGLLFANMILAARALQPIERLVGSWDGLTNGWRAYDRLMKLFDMYKPETQATQLPKATGQLSVESVSFVAPGGGRLILQGVNFSLQAGEMLGVIGPSGAGKSTLSRLLMGINAPSQGVIRLDGADIYSWNRAEFGQNVGYLPQDTELFAGTIRDNIARFRSDIPDSEVIRAARIAGVHDLILRLPAGYDTELGEAAQALSAGQKQRVGFARAIVGDPKFIVLDEPNASLDAEGEEALLAGLDVMKAHGCTIVVVSHKPGIFRSADKMLVLRDGRMEMFGPRDAVWARVTQAQPVRAVEASR